MSPSPRFAGRGAIVACILLSFASIALARTRAVPSVQKIGHHRVALTGVYTQFERRGWPSEYWTGDLVRRLDDFDPVVGSTVAAEVEKQLDAMAALNVNTITLELRTASDGSDPSYAACDVPPVLGFHYPDPAPSDLTKLRQLFDIVQAHRMRIFLRLASTHQDDAFENAQRWLGPILNAIGHHPALDLILFEGDVHTVDTNGDGVPDGCGFPAEPPLWLGPNTINTAYIKSAIRYALSLGVDPRKLSSEEIVGSYMFDVRSGAGSAANDRHLWPTVEVMRDIFDEVGIPASQRTYALSMYEHRKCDNVPSFVTPPCVDEDPDTWADESLKNVFDIVGRGNGARVVAPEFGIIRPVSSAWRTEWAVESLARVFEKYGVEGGTYWVWIHFNDSEDADPTVEDAVKRRGVAFTYNAVANEIADMGGFHLNSIANASFESGDSTPSSWSASGDGTIARVDIGQAEVPSRGRYALRVTTGSSSNATIEAVSAPIVASSGITYTTTLNLRFESGSNVYVAIREYDAAGNQIGETVTRFSDVAKTDGFDTFPIRYTTPALTTSVRIAIGATRNGSSAPVIVDADNVR